MKKVLDDLSIKERLLRVGILVTDKAKKGDKGCRMLTDLNGKEIGYFTPLKALEEFEPCPHKILSRDFVNQKYGKCVKCGHVVIS